MPVLLTPAWSLASASWAFVTIPETELPRKPPPK